MVLAKFWPLLFCTLRCKNLSADLWRPMITELTRQQMMYARLLWDQNVAFRFHDHFLLRSAVEVKPAPDLRRLERTINKVAERHDTLRLRIRMVDDVLVGDIPDKLETPLQVIEHKETDRKQVEEIVQDYAKTPINVQTEQLFQCSVLLFPNDYFVVFRVSHVLFDAFSAVLFLEEFLKFLIGLPVLSKPIKHQDYLKGWARVPKSILHMNDCFWEDTVLPLKGSSGIGLNGKGLDMMSPYDEFQIISNSWQPDKTTANNIRAACAQAGTSLVALLSVCLARALHKLGASKDLVITNSLNRVDGALTTYMGVHTSLVPTFVDASPDLNILQQAGNVTDQIQQAFQHLPCDTLGPGGALGDALTQAGYSRNNFFVHTPRASSRERSSMFSHTFGKESEKFVRGGKYSFRNFPLEERTATLSELQLNLMNPEDDLSIELHANELGFSHDDLCQIIAMIKDDLKALAKQI